MRQRDHWSGCSGLHFAQQQHACARPIVAPERWPLRVAPIWSGVEVSPPGSCGLALGTAPHGTCHSVVDALRGL